MKLASGIPVPAFSLLQALFSLMSTRMRPPYLMLFTIGLIAASSSMIFRTCSQNESSAEKPKTTKRSEKRPKQSAVSHRLPPTGAIQDQTVTDSATIHPNGIRSEDSYSAEAIIPSPSMAMPPAVQLADDVRLPAALIPDAGANLTPAVTAATAEIGNTFYRDLQVTANNETSNQEADTATISNDPNTEQALIRADEQYRALFGDEDFNRKTAESHIEVNLPTDSSE